MFMKFKRFLALSLTLCLGLTGMVMPAYAESGVFTDTCNWPPVNSYIANYYAANGVGWQIGSMTYEGMFCLVAVSGTVYPRLAESYEQDDFTDTIHLRQDVKYNDGEPFTAKDIWSYYMLNNTCTVSQQAKSIEMVDDYTIRITWREQINPGVRIRMIATNNDAQIPYHIFSEYVDKAAELLATGVETRTPPTAALSAWSTPRRLLPLWMPTGRPSSSMARRIRFPWALVPTWFPR